MPVYGSRAVYAEPRDTTKQMKQKARAQGFFPEVTQGSQEMLHKQLQRINKTNEVASVRTRRMQLDDRLNYELQTDRMMSDLRGARMHNFRGLGAKMVNAERVASQIT